ncbi:hypothetical protein [Halosimplex amylolyticum]
MPVSDRECEVDRRETSNANGVLSNEVRQGSGDERSESPGERSDP